jgi:hypothetical protein
VKEVLEPSEYFRVTAILQGTKRFGGSDNREMDEQQNAFERKAQFDISHRDAERRRGASGWPVTLNVSLNS